MNTIKGVKDLMDHMRYQPKHLKKKLKESNTPGNWDSYQNIYNLINGLSTPRDPYVYIVLSRMLDVSVETILYRYSTITEMEETEEVDSPNEESEINWNY